MNTIRVCNAKLHGMEKVEPEHIAYAFIQSRFSIAARDKWHETDGCYKYSEAYTRLIKAIRDAPDQTWAESLLQWWNQMVFGNKNGLIVIDLTKDDEDDDLVVMQKQHEMRVAAAHQKAQLSESENVAAIPVTAEDTAVSSTSMQQSKATEPLVPPLASPSATPHSMDPESVKRMLGEFQDDDPLTEDETDMPAPSKRARKARKTTATSKKTRKGRK